MLGGGIPRQTPTVGPAEAVGLVDEVRRRDIALHLQERQALVKALAALLAQAAETFQLPGAEFSPVGEDFHDPLILVSRQSVVHPRVVIIAVAAVVGKVREPVPADVHGTAAVKLSVGAGGCPDDRPLPFPGAPAVGGSFPHDAGVFLDGEARDLSLKIGQESQLIHQANDILFCLDFRQEHGFHLFFIIPQNFPIVQCAQA